MLNTVISTAEECVGGWIQMSCSRVEAADDLFAAGDTLMLNDWSAGGTFMCGTLIWVLFLPCTKQNRRFPRHLHGGETRAYLWARKISVTITSKHQLCQDPRQHLEPLERSSAPCEISYRAPCPVVHLTSSGSDPPERVTANCSHITSFRRQRRRQQQQQHHSAR